MNFRIVDNRKTLFEMGVPEFPSDFADANDTETVTAAEGDDASAVTPSDPPAVPVTFNPLDSGGTLGYSGCKVLAESCNARLPTIDEVRAELARGDNQPLFEQDMWWPVSDAPDTWISVGNYDPSTRLGRTHNELFGVPAWNESDTYLAERLVIATVSLEALAAAPDVAVAAVASSAATKRRKGTGTRSGASGAATPSTPSKPTLPYATVWDVENSNRELEYTDGTPPTSAKRPGSNSCYPAAFAVIPGTVSTFTVQISECGSMENSLSVGVCRFVRDASGFGIVCLLSLYLF